MLKSDSVFFFRFFFWGFAQAVFNQSQDQGRGRRGGGVAVHPGYEGAGICDTWQAYQRIRAY